MPSTLQDDVKQELIETSEQLISTQAQRDRNAMKLEQLAQKQGADASGPPGNQGDGEGDEEGDMGVLTGHLNRIAALEKEVKRLKQVCTMMPYCSVMHAVTWWIESMCSVNRSLNTCLVCLVLMVTWLHVCSLPPCSDFQATPSALRKALSGYCISGS